MAGVSRSGHLERESRPKKALSRDERLILTLFKKDHSKLGYRRLKMAFERKTGELINVKKVRRIKRKLCLETLVRRKNPYRAGFRALEESHVAPNFLRRNFTPSNSQVLLSTDVSELKFAHGQKAYLAAVKDLGTKEIVAFDVRAAPTIGLAIESLVALLEGWPRSERLKTTVHSDQGFQYTSRQLRDGLARLEVRQSMSRKGNCLDNAPIESFFGHLKDEADIKRCKSLGELKRCVARYMHFYNYERPQWGLKQMTPAEARVKLSLVY